MHNWLLITIVISFNKKYTSWEPSFHIHCHCVCSISTMLWKKEIETKKSTSTFLVFILNPIMLFFGRYISMTASERRLHLQDCSQHVAIWSYSDRVHRKRINKDRIQRNQTGNCTPYISSIAIGAQKDRFQVAFDRQQSVSWSGSIAALQNVDWRSVVCRSPSCLIHRWNSAIGVQIGRNRIAGTPKSPPNQCDSWRSIRSRKSP